MTPNKAMMIESDIITAAAVVRRGKLTLHVRAAISPSERNMRSTSHARLLIGATSRGDGRGRRTRPRPRPRRRVHDQRDRARTRSPRRPKPVSTLILHLTIWGRYSAA
jgi:hypothetical protein